MCRSITPLFNFDPPATNEEVRAAALQFVRKVSGYREPSQVNKAAFDHGVDEIATATRELLAALTTATEPKDREAETEKRRQTRAKSSSQTLS
jgi:hypothetical protein